MNALVLVGLWRFSFGKQQPSDAAGCVCVCVGAHLRLVSVSSRQFGKLPVSTS